MSQRKRGFHFPYLEALTPGTSRLRLLGYFSIGLHVWSVSTLWRLSFMTGSLGRQIDYPALVRMPCMYHCGDDQYIVWHVTSHQSKEFYEPIVSVSNRLIVRFSATRNIVFVDQLNTRTHCIGPVLIHDISEDDDPCLKQLQELNNLLDSLTPHGRPRPSHQHLPLCDQIVCCNHYESPTAFIWPYA